MICLRHLLGTLTFVKNKREKEMWEIERLERYRRKKVGKWEKERERDKGGLRPHTVKIQNLGISYRHYMFLNNIKITLNNTVCPESSDPFYIVIYYIKLVTTSWTQSNVALTFTVFFFK